MLSKTLKELVVTFGITGFAGTAVAGLNAVDPGPYTAGTGHFPVWYEDLDPATNPSPPALQLELCLSRATSVNGPMCTLLANPGIFDPALPIVWPVNFPDESFWFSAGATIDATTPTGGVISLVYDSALEAAFAGGNPAPGDQISFARIRIRADVPVPGDYTITHPYGVENFTVTLADCGGVAAGPCPGAINMTRDVGIGGANDFTGALAGDIGPFLQSVNAPYTATNPDTGELETFIGDPNILENVTGSPFGTDYVKIEKITGGVIDFSAQTLDFNVSGKLWGGQVPVPVTIDRATYRHHTVAEGTHLEVFASAPVTATVTHRESLPLGTENAMTGDGAGNWYGSAPTQPPLVVVTASAAGSTRSVLSSPVTDLVRITRATFDRNTGELLIEATSSDEVNVPTLIALGVGDLTPTTAPIQQLASTVAEPRATITVQSSAGGSDTEPLHVICSDCDDDGIQNAVDNCSTIPNVDQADTDGDGIGDVCDTCTDTDGDTFGDPGFAANNCPLDNCPINANPLQEDADGDAVGDVCDTCTDTDGDTFGDPGFAANTCPLDNCPVVGNADQLDGDTDGVGNVCDNCTLVANANQRDTDADGFGNICDADFNGDGLVTLSDYSVFRSKFGTADPDADFNGDGLVTLSDYSTFRSLFGKAPGPSALQAPAP